MAHINVPPGMIAPRPVRPLTDAERSRLAAQVTTEQLERLVTRLSTRPKHGPSRRPRVRSASPNNGWTR